MLKRLAGEVAIVTGAASGIGLATAQRLIEEGARVLFADINGDDAARAASVHGVDAVPATVDIASEDGVEAMFVACETSFGPATILVNCGGHAQIAPPDILTVADFDRMIAVHLRGTFLACRRAIPGMLAGGHGSIVNVASQLGQRGHADMPHYCAAKAGIIGLTKSLALAYARRGIRVNAVAPGPILTPITRIAPVDLIASIADALPLGRFGEVQEVASAIAFLASGDSSLFIGQTLGPNSGDVML